MKLEGLVARGTLQLRPNRESQILAQALHAAGALSSVKTIDYGVGEPIALSGEMLDLIKLSQLIASEGADAVKLKTLMALRATLSPTSYPTRESLTAEIIRVIESEAPEISLKVAQAARDHLVVNAKAESLTGNPWRRTLNLNLLDSADLKLARLLTNLPVTASVPGRPNGKTTGLRDVEIIVFNGIREKPTVGDPTTSERKLKRDWEAVNYPKFIEVYDEAGSRISDRLAPSNYSTALKTRDHPVIPDSALWRTPAFLADAQYSDPTKPRGSLGDPAGCPMENLAPTQK